MNKARYNSEGYADPTAYEGMKDVIREEAEAEADRRCNMLIGALKDIIKLSGFELTERVQLRDKKTGREYM